MLRSLIDHDDLTAPLRNALPTAATPPAAPKSAAPPGRPEHRTLSTAEALAKSSETSCEFRDRAEFGHMVWEALDMR